MGYLMGYMTFQNVMEGFLGTMALLGGIAACCRYLLKRRTASLLSALITPPLATSLLLCSLVLHYFADEDFKLTYVGTGAQPGPVYWLLSAVFLIFAIMTLVLGLKAAVGKNAPPTRAPIPKQRFTRLGI